MGGVLVAGEPLGVEATAVFKGVLIEDMIHWFSRFLFIYFIYMVRTFQPYHDTVVRGALQGLSLFTVAGVGVESDVKSLEGFFMNYRKNYDDYMAWVKTQNRYKTSRSDPSYVYYERHHVVPRCLGGSDGWDNTVLLTFREHVLAHYILTKIFPSNLKLQMAFSAFLFGHGGQFSYLSSWLLQRSRELASAAASAHMKGFKQSDETKNKRSISLIGRHYHTESSKLAISIKNKSRDPSVLAVPLERRLRISATLQGRKRSPEATLAYITSRRNGKGWGKPIVCVETGQVFPSTASAEQHLIKLTGKKRFHICEALKSGDPCAGFHWVFKESV
jgi:hypothetical protein